MKAYSFHPQAEAELVEAARYYEARSVGLGHSFLAEVRRAIDQVRADPESAPVVEGTIRRKVLRRFPYNLLYAVEPPGIRIFAVMHQKRRPGYWRGRL